jgi:hypothetical protein
LLLLDVGMGSDIFALASLFASRMSARRE